MSDDDPTAQQDSVQVPVTQEAPQWASDLLNELRTLPGKIKATVTDEDRRSLAESVHELFEGSGAFEREDPPPPPANDDIPEATVVTEAPPAKRSGMKGWAARFMGEE